MCTSRDEKCLPPLCVRINIGLQTNKFDMPVPMPLPLPTPVHKLVLVQVLVQVLVLSLIHLAGISLTSSLAERTSVP